MLADALIGTKLRKPGMMLEAALLESRLDVLAVKHANVSTEHDPLAQHREGAAIVKHFADHDPTPNKQYTDRVMHWYSKGSLRQEDAHRVKHALTAFHANRARISEKDINRYGSLQDLETAVEPFEKRVETPWVKATQGQRDAVEKGSEVVHDDPKLTVRKVNTHEAMKVLGSRTKWCVVPEKDTFDHYAKMGPLYHLHDKETGARHLLSFASDQLMDERDKPASSTALAKKHPVLHKLFAGESYTKFSNPTDLERDHLAGRPISHVARAQMAAHSKNPAVLSKLANDTSSLNYTTEPTHNVVARNPHTPPEVLRGIYHRGWTAPLDQERNPNMMGAQSRDQATDTTRRTVVANPNAPHDLLHQHVDTAFRDDHVSQVRDAALNPNAPHDLIRKIYAKSYEGLAKTVGDKPAGSEQEMKQRADRLHGILKAHLQNLGAVAQNPNTPHDVLRHMEHHWRTATGSIKWAESPGEQIPQNPNAPADVLHNVALTASPTRGWVHTSIAAHKNVSPETLNYLIDQRGLQTSYTSLGGLHQAVAENPNADAEVLHKVALQRGRVNSAIAMAVAKHPKTDVATLHHLWKNEAERSKRKGGKGLRITHLNALARHPNAPAEWGEALKPVNDQRAARRAAKKAAS